MKIEIPSHIDATWLVAVVAAFVIAFIVVRKEPQREIERLRKEIERLKEEVERLQEVSQNDLRNEPQREITYTLERLHEEMEGLKEEIEGVKSQLPGKRLYDAACDGKVAEVSISLKSAHKL